MAQSGARQHHDAAMLKKGRDLYLSHCGRCHALPDIGSETADEWPQIVAKMAKRAGLNATQEQSITAYILAAQATAK